MRILVLCTGNSSRSQMAEGIFKDRLNKNDEVYSAGLEPRGVNPTAIKVMKEIRIDISQQTSDHLNKYLDDTFDYVITVCDNAAEHCPRFPGDTQHLHWPFDDPAAVKGDDQAILQAFRDARDGISKRIDDWIRDLSPWQS